MAVAPDIAARIERFRALPPAMQERPQWLLWRYVKKEGVEKLAKMPFYVSGRKRHGEQGSTSDREELKTFEVAVSEFARGRYDGIGFAFLPGDGFIGVDIDGAVNEDGEISERCQAIVKACASYTEWSVSRKGVHIICAGETKTFKDNSIGLEVFCGRQFFTCTGERWEDLPAEVGPMDEGTLKRLQATVRQAQKAAAAARRPAPAAAPAPAKPPPPAAAQGRGADDFVEVNNAAMRDLDAWVPALFPGAKRHAATGGWRVQSSALGRDLQEDLTITPEGIVDWGVADLGDAKQGRRTPIDLVVEWGRMSAKDALHWLAGKLGMALQRPAGGRSSRSSKGAGAASTPSPGSAAGGGEGGGGDAGDDGPPPDESGDGRPKPKPREAWRNKLLYEKGAVRDCRENVFLMLTHHPKLQGLVGYDEFAHRVMKLTEMPWDSQPGEWNTNDDYALGFWLAVNERMAVRAETTLIAGVAMAAWAGRYHPVHAYLRGLAPWDGIERLPYWLSECVGAEESDYTKTVGPWFLMGMVKRILTPGCQMDYMVVLEGLQGKQKSTALRTLVGNDDWFADTPIRIGDKDALLSLAGKWLYEVGELDSFNKAEVTAVKQYVSSRIDRVREPFARRPADRPRSGVFAATTNQSEYFKDPTGARRFWPVACDGDIDIKKLAAWRDQLFAEAMARLSSEDEEKRRYWPTREETELLLVPQQERREINDPWFEKLAIWLESSAMYGESGLQVCEVDKFTSHDLLVKALNVPTDRIDSGRQMATRVGIAMHKLGWGKERDSTGARLWRYLRPKAKPKATDNNAPAQGPAESGGRAPAGDGAPLEVLGG
jgi:putative DNA primase/helicase